MPAHFIQMTPSIFSGEAVLMPTELCCIASALLQPLPLWQTQHKTSVPLKLCSIPFTPSITHKQALRVLSDRYGKSRPAMHLQKLLCYARFTINRCMGFWLSIFTQNKVQALAILRLRCKLPNSKSTPAMLFLCKAEGSYSLSSTNIAGNNWDGMARRIKFYILANLSALAAMFQ